jgi:hypothetical protein
MVFSEEKQTALRDAVSLRDGHTWTRPKRSCRHERWRLNVTFSQEQQTLKG